MPNIKSMKRRFLSAVLLGASLCSLPNMAQAQLDGFTKTNAGLKLAQDSPFRDPDIIYLEADELENDQEGNILIASGQVIGRYQDKTIRADQVKYNLTTGQVIAIGNVTLINANGSTQHADKLELSGELETGTATDFTARFAQGGQLSAAFAKRNTQDGVELYNAYYTACEACVKDGKTKKPTWRLKARKVTQDARTKSIRYRDAVFEFKGVPLFYTPYLAHPDPSVGRASGLMMPFGGVSKSKGLNIRTPYYFALSPYSELTLTPHVYQKVNPLLEAQYKRKFYSGEINLEGSATYSSFFDNDGNILTDQTVFINPDESLASKKWRSHFFANGSFDINDTWKWGFQGGYATDDNYLNRYDLEETQREFGLYKAANRRLMQQVFVVGQNDSFRFSTSAFGITSLRSAIRGVPLLNASNQLIQDPVTGEYLRDNNVFVVSREDDSALPVVAPKIEVTKYIEDPVLGGRLKLFGDTTVLTRQHGTNGSTELATGYIRATGGVNWQRNWIAPMGVEIKPFANAKHDYFKLEAEDEPAFDFSRTTAQVGVDIRWPFMKPGKKVNWILEPRVQVTQSFGDGKLNKFNYAKTNGDIVNLAQDGIDVDLDQALLWSSNKSTGYDIWQEGFRVDVGASLIADWGKSNRASLFLGQSYYSGSENAFDITSGLQEDKSDLVGQFELKLGKHFSSTTRVRYDEDNSAFRRLDTGFSYTDNRFRANVRYYKVDSASVVVPTDPNEFGPPTEEISGTLSVRLFDNWSTSYQLNHDIDRGATRRQALSLIYDDDCTRIEFTYSKRENGLGIIGQSDGFGIRISLLSLGDFSPG
ncbi:MAG: hypothetical protein COA69_00225 [Robiginitomaculum sp.]|nr:MAG: hypothetical protein COA69_00225 [Robiginitomaculum sp.]